ncbi:MAG TPA: DinB family protein [Aggregatilineales bacterium]|nr:DinB family protein [Anaerolineales bacterium]HRE48288.1 DinB family protein [Aggregatilineales bacterium]
MNRDDIYLLYDYNDWADRRILTMCAKISHEQYTAPTTIGTGYGSLRATLVHIVSAMQLWRMLFTDPPNVYRSEEDHTALELTEAEFPTLSVLEKRWQEERDTLRAYLNTLDDGKVKGVLRYTLPNGIVRERVLWHCLVHLVNHGTQHRSEAAVLLTGYGQSPGDIDMTVFLNEHFNLPS